jgi:hypothetical protein
MAARALNIIIIFFIALYFFRIYFNTLIHYKVNACKGYNVLYGCDLTACERFLRYNYNTAVRVGIGGEKKARNIFLLLKKWQHFKRREGSGKLTFFGFFYVDIK